MALVIDLFLGLEPRHFARGILDLADAGSAPTPSWAARSSCRWVAMAISASCTEARACSTKFVFSSSAWRAAIGSGLGRSDHLLGPQDSTSSASS